MFHRLTQELGRFPLPCVILYHTCSTLFRPYLTLLFFLCFTLTVVFVLVRRYYLFSKTSGMFRDDFHTHCWVLSQITTLVLSLLGELLLVSSVLIFSDIACCLCSCFAAFRFSFPGRHSSLQIEMNPTRPRAFVDARFLGPDSSVEPLRTKLALALRAQQWFASCFFLIFLVYSVKCSQG